MAFPFNPKQYLPFLDSAWFIVPEILRYTDFDESAWDSDAEKPLAELAEAESGTLPSHPSLPQAARVWDSRSSFIP